MAGAERRRVSVYVWKVLRNADPRYTLDTATFLAPHLFSSGTPPTGRAGERLRHGGPNTCVTVYAARGGGAPHLFMRRVRRVASRSHDAGGWGDVVTPRVRGV